MSYPVTVTAAGASLDPCRVALPLEIIHGRSGTDTQPDAPAATFTWLGETAPFTLGDPLYIETAGQPGETWTGPGVLWTDVAVSWLGTRGRTRRFTGHIRTLRAVEALGKVVAWEVEAIGDQSRLGFMPLELSRPAETDVARVQAIAAALGVTIEIRGDPGPTLYAWNYERNDALSALHEVCASSGGILWQERDGTLVYGTMYRHRQVYLWRLGCELVSDGVEWNNGYDNVLNHLTVVYGPPDPVAAGEHPNPHAEQQDTYRDDDSIAQWGYRHADITTQCATSSDAALLAVAILARRKQPRWVMPGVVALRDKSSAAAWAQVANVDFGHTVLVNVEETPTPTPGLATSWTVEGWVETWEQAGWRVQLALSEYRLGVPIPWSYADGFTWEHWATTASWLEAMVEV